jgi:L-alanine-DL-glutamate epimerase-like enolase superfamily enzyme
MTRDCRNVGRGIAGVSRRTVLCAPLVLPVALAGGSAAPAAQPKGVKRLRITKVHTVEIRNVPAGQGLVLPWDAKKMPLDTRDYVVTQFVTDQGLIGTTMDGDYRLPVGIGRTVQERAEAYFIGKDPLDVELHNAQFFQTQKAPVRLFFLEVGLWDLVGKVCGQPLCKLWGAHSDKVRAYAATVHFDRTPARRAEDARRFYEQGFRAIKLRMHHDRVADDLKLVAAVREAVGDKMAIMVDANQAGKTAKSPPPVWDYGRALTMAKELEQMSVSWLEEPLNRDALEDLARLRKQLTRMHLAGAEGDIGLERFRRILTAGAFSYLQPDPMIGGGISVIRKIAAMAEAFGVLFGPHHGKSGVGMLADLHMQCAAPNSGYLEYMYDPGFWNPEGFQVGFTAPYPIDREGYVHAPQAPGLGAPWSREFFDKHQLYWES